MPATSLGSRAYDSGVNNFISRSRTHKITATNETQDAAVACGEWGGGGALQDIEWVAQGAARTTTALEFCFRSRARTTTTGSSSIRSCVNILSCRLFFRGAVGFLSWIGAQDEGRTAKDSRTAVGRDQFETQLPAPWAFGRS